MTLQLERNGVKKAAQGRTSSELIAATLTLRWPWWINPVWATILLSGSMAVIAVILPDSAYSLWETPKYVGPDEAAALLLGVAVFSVSMLVITFRVMRGGPVTIQISYKQLNYLQVAYKVLFSLTVVGYALWFLSAVVRGVNLSTVLSVLSLEQGAISGLKRLATPIGGVTTLTQFGMLAIALGVLLKRIGAASNAFWWILVLSMFRALFYAERLATIEVALSLLVVFVGVMYARRSRRAKWIAVAPLIAIPAIWGIFAALEYTRSWIYYQNLVSQSYFEWVTIRLLGYYVTSYNNSALLDQLRSGSADLPYFSIPGLWNAPVLSSLLPAPTVFGQSPSDWWWWVLNTYGNPGFTNPGSFLTTQGEFGTAGMVAYWAVAGLLIGWLFVSMRRGSPIAMIGFASLYVGILELPRIIYWGEGRAFPTILALLVMGLTYPVARKIRVPATRLERG